jgi:hypothetical protein
VLCSAPREVSAAGRDVGNDRPARVAEERAGSECRDDPRPRSRARCDTSPRKWSPRRAEGQARLGWRRARRAHACMAPRARPATATVQPRVNAPRPRPRNHHATHTRCYATVRRGRSTHQPRPAAGDRAGRTNMRLRFAPPVRPFPRDRRHYGRLASADASAGPQRRRPQRTLPCADARARPSPSASLTAEDDWSLAALFSPGRCSDENTKLWLWTSSGNGQIYSRIDRLTGCSPSFSPALTLAYDNPVPRKYCTYSSSCTATHDHSLSYRDFS